MPSVGDCVEVFWTEDDRLYRGTLDGVDDGSNRVMYDDGDVELLNIISKTWNICDKSTTQAQLPLQHLTSGSQDFISAISFYFENKPFM